MSTLVALDEAARGKLQDLLALDGGVEGEVEALEGLR